MTLKVEPVPALIALGANLGDLEETFRTALTMLAQTEGVQVVRVSSYYRTYPVGGPERQPIFLNAVALLDTALSPFELLEELHRIERALKRVRSVFWGPRTLDLDIILFGNTTFETKELTIPHPRLCWRNFVLDPACEIVPDCCVPNLNMSFHELRTLLYWNFFAFEVFCFFLKRTALCNVN